MKPAALWKSCVAALACVLLPSVGNAQTTAEGYFLGGPGAYSDPFSSGQVFGITVGGEALVHGRLGIGGDLGLVLPGFGFPITLNTTWYFLRNRATRMVTPYLGGGYTRLTAPEFIAVNGLTFRGGLAYWFNDSRGLILEVRDVRYRIKGSGRAQYWTAAVGVGFR